MAQVGEKQVCLRYSRMGACPEQEILEEAGLSSCGVWSRQQGEGQEEFAGWAGFQQVRLAVRKQSKQQHCLSEY